MPPPETLGVLYVATGKKYITSAIRSAHSVRAFCPDLPIHIFANWQNYDFKFDNSSALVFSQGQIDQPHRRSKVEFLAQTPFKRTLYLDSDTCLNADIRGMFALLERFDIALTHAHWRNHPITSQQWTSVIPSAFPQFNTGVVLYRKNPAVLQLLQDWQTAFRKAEFAQDQVTLRELLWHSNLRIATLPPEYNVRFIKYHYIWAKSEAQTKIFHLQKYHDGPFWFVKVWAKRTARTILKIFHLYPLAKKMMDK